MEKKKKYTGPRVRDTETFVKKAKWVHGETYDYTESSYTTAKTKISINCRVHGNFDQTPDSHLSGKGCPFCRDEETAKRFSSDTNTFIAKSEEVHDSFYDYSYTNYFRNSIPVVITCPIHGDFKQTPQNHLAGSGCYYCGRSKTENSRLKNTEWFVNKAKKIHGNAYNYSETEYHKNEEKLQIICPKHGPFYQFPSTHFRGSGCLECARDVLGYGKSGYYGTTGLSNMYITILDNRMLKIGLAKNLKVRERYISWESGYSVKTVYSVEGEACELFDLEQKILRKSNLKRFYPEESFAGSTECLELSELPKVLQIIEDWEKSNAESFSETS